MASRYRTALAATAAVGAMAFAFSFPPVRGAAAQLLSVFRMQEVRAVTLSADDLRKLEQAFHSGDSKVDLRGMGQLEVQGKPERRESTPEAATRAAGIRVKAPPAAPEGYGPARVIAQSGATASFTFNVDNFNRVLKALGSEKLLPRSVDGKQVTIELPPAVVYEYEPKPPYSGRYVMPVHVAMLRSPELRAPADVEAVREAILGLPILPESIRLQLASNDWSKTVLVPSVQLDGKATAENITINGKPAVIIGEHRPDGGPLKLLWLDNGVVHAIDGKLTREQALKLAAALR